MKTISAIASSLLAVFFIASCTGEDPAGHASAQTAVPVNEHTQPDELVKRGEYLIQVMGCHDCHSPKKMTEHGPVPDPDLLLSGHPAEQEPAPIADRSILKDYALFNMGLTAAVGPWGTSFAANLTPDETGLGSWSIDQFRKALKEGKSKGLDNGRMLLPPMPWPNFQNLAEADLEAMWAYLQSVKPVSNLVPAPVPPVQ